MIYSIHLTTQAQADLKEIYHYIAVRLQEPQNAEHQLNRIEQAIASLDQFPERYRLYDKPKWRKKNLRVSPVDNYLVFYIPNPSDATVNIIRVLYGGRDIHKIL